MNDLYFMKLGGSLITDKTAVETPRLDIMKRIATEIQQAKSDYPDLKLVLGHGSGSYGHVVAARYNTRSGVGTADEWKGFADVSATAAKLNRLVLEAMLESGIPAITLQPSATIQCRDGRIIHMNQTPIRAALDAGLVPIIYGDVAFDTEIGGTIVSTEEIMGYLTPELDPSWLLLAGEVSGVLDQAGQIVRLITWANLEPIQSSLGGSHGTDVTGGMASKVTGMLKLTKRCPNLAVRIFSGLKAGSIRSVLLNADDDQGTIIKYLG